MQKQPSVFHPEFTEKHRPHGDCWLHNAQPIWIVHYPVLKEQRKPSFIAYRAVDYLPAGRDPWTVNNRRCGEYNTIEEAMAAYSAPGSKCILLPDNAKLCEIYEVATYPVEALNENPSPEEAGKFFVSTLKGTFEDSPKIPLANTEAEAEALAVEHLNLKTLYGTQMTNVGTAGCFV